MDGIEGKRERGLLFYWSWVIPNYEYSIPAALSRKTTPKIKPSPFPTTPPHLAKYLQHTSHLPHRKPQSASHNPPCNISEFRKPPSANLIDGHKSRIRGSRFLSSGALSFFAFVFWSEYDRCVGGGERSDRQAGGWHWHGAIYYI
jgi:hypothetical protein